MIQICNCTQAQDANGKHYTLTCKKPGYQFLCEYREYDKSKREKPDGFYGGCPATFLQSMNSTHHRCCHFAIWESDVTGEL